MVDLNTQIANAAHDPKARLIDSTWERLKKTALPAIAAHKSGRFFVIARLAPQADGSTKVLVHDPDAGRPVLITEAELL